VIIDGDVGNADTLYDFGMLAIARYIQRNGLGAAARSGEACCNE
jgi:hypothetical protein